MAGKNFIYFGAVAAISSFVLFGKKKKPKTSCMQVNTRNDLSRALGGNARFPVAIVYYPDGVTPEKAEAFCRLTVLDNITVVLVKASNYNRWTGESVPAGIAIMSSPSKGAFKTWEELGA